MKKSALNPSSIKGAKFNPKLYEKPGLSEDEVIEIKEAFDLFDPEGNGSVDPKGISELIA
jgi:Ca2+-binding EF-hand superfamily protein